MSEQEEVKKRISGKKIALIIIPSLLAALLLAVGLFFGIMSCTGKRNAPSDLKEGYTVRKVAPTDGSTPADHSGIDNVAFMAYVLDNQQFYHSYANNSTKSTGYEQITQTWKDYKSAAANGTANNVMVCSDLSYSSLVKASTQTCFVGNDSAYMRTGNKPGKNSTPADVNWSGDQPVYYNAESYGKKYGAFSTELSVYVINEDTVESCGEVIDNEDGTYSQKFTLNKDAACWYQYGMKTRGSLKALPDFKKIEITFTFDGSWQVLQSYCEEKTDISPSALGGMTMGSTAKTTTTFDYGEAGFDGVHFAQFANYYEKYVGKDLTPPDETSDVPALLDVLGGGFSKVVDPNGNGQKFAMGINLGGTEYSGTAYAKLGDMGDILGSLNVRLALGKKGGEKQDLFIEFINGGLNLYYGEDFAMNADINGVAESVTKIIDWVNALGKVEAQDVAYALSGDTEGAENSSGLDLDSLINALSFTYTDTSACIAVVSDDLLGLGIGLNVQINFNRFKEEDGSTYAFKDFGLSSLSYNGTPVNLSLTLLPDDNAADVSHNESEAGANLADYINGVYNLLNGNSYVVDIKLDGTSEIEYISGLTLNASAQVAQAQGFKEISVNVPLTVEYGKLAIDLEAYYTVNVESGSYGTVYLWVKEISGTPVNAKVYCEINEVIEAVKKVIAFFTTEEGEENAPAVQAESEEESEEVNAVASIINLVLGLDYEAIITDLKADKTEIGVTINVDEILKAFEIDLGFDAGSVELRLVNGEKATLRGSAEKLGLEVTLSGSDEKITAPEAADYCDLASYVNGVYNLLNGNSIEVKIELDGTSEIEYLSGVILNANAMLRLENGYNDISVSIPLSISYQELSAVIEVYYTVNTRNGSYGEVYLNVVSLNNQSYGLKIYCNINETETAVKELIEFINSIGKEEDSAAQISYALNETYETGDANEATDKIAAVINAVIGIDYGKIISELKANAGGVSITVNADEILNSFGVNLNGLSLGELKLNIGLDGKNAATLSGCVEKLGVKLNINGSEREVKAPEEEYLNVNEFIEIVKVAAEQAKEIIEAESVFFNVEDLALTADGVKMSVNANGEVSWQNDKIRVAALATFEIAENENSEKVEVAFVYDETSYGTGAPLVRFTVNGLGFEIYEEDINEVTELINKIINAVNGFIGGADAEDKTENSGVATLSADGAQTEGENEEQANGIIKLFGAVLNTVSKITVELRDSGIDGASVRDIFIGYASGGKLTLGANGGLAIKLNIADGNGTEIANFVANVCAGNGAEFDSVNEKLDNCEFYEGETFVKEIYDYVLNLLDNLSVKNLLGGDTYTVDLAFNGTDSGIKELEGIIVNAHLYYTEVEENENTNKLVEAFIDLDIKGVKVVAQAHVLNRTVYISLDHVAGTDLKEVAFKADTDNIYEAAKTVVEIITSKTLSEIVALIPKTNKTADSADGAEPVELSEEGKTELADILNYILTLDFNEVISCEKADGKNTLTVKPDGILEAFGVNVKIGEVKVAVNPETHSIEASVKGEREWLTFLAQAVENSEHGTFNPAENYIDINFVSTLLEDINASLKYVEETSPEGETIFSLKTAESEKINVDIPLLKDIDIDDITITAGIKEDKSFYFSFRGHINNTIALGTLTEARYIGVTYSDGYITMGKDVDDSNKATYKVMTPEYLIDNLTADNSPVRWLLGTNSVNWGTLSGVLNNIVKLGLNSGLTNTETLNLYYLYGGSNGEDNASGETPEEEVKQFSLSDYINGINVNLGNGKTSLYGNNASAAVGELGLNGSTDYYAFDVKLSTLTSAIKTLYAAILRNDNGGLKGLCAYADISGFVKIRANITGGLTGEHAPDYREIVNEKHNVNYDNFAGQEYKTFGCYSSEGNGSYAASDYNRPYKLTVYGYNGIENYVVNQRGEEQLLSKTLNSGSVINLLEGDIWLDSEKTVKLIYVDENGNDMGSAFRLTSDAVIYQMASGRDKIILHSPYEEDSEIIGYLGASLANPAVTVYDNGTPNDYSDDYLFAGWYADAAYTKPVNSITEGVTEYFARFIARRYVAENGVVYEFSNVANEADNIKYYYTAADFTNNADRDYSDSENVLKIADYINGFPVTAIGKSAFKNKGIKKVIVPETVTRVEAQAFMDNKDMELAVFLAPSVYFGGEDWGGDNRFVFYGTGTSANENVTKLNLYFNNATSHNGNTNWFGFKKDGKNYYFIGNETGSRNGKYIDHTGTNVLYGKPWAYIEYVITGANGVNLSELKNGITTVGRTQAEIEAYVLNALNEATKINGYINAYNAEVSGGFEINANSFGYALTVEINVTEKLEPAWYQLTVQTNYNGNATAVSINGNYEIISESETSVSYYVQAGAEVILSATQAENGVYSFDGWQVNGERRDNPITATFTVYSEVTEIRAVWNAAENDNITVISAIDFSFNGESYVAGENAVKAAVNDNLATPEAAGYDFLGWAQEADGIFTVDESTFIERDTVATYYALWAVSKNNVKFTLSGTTVTAETNGENVYGWYNGTSEGFTGALLAEGDFCTVTAQSTVVSLRLKYTLTVNLESSDLTWYHNKAENSATPKDMAISSSVSSKVSNGTQATSLPIIADIDMLEGYTVNVYRYWTNGLAIQILDGESDVATYFIKGRYTYKSWGITNYAWRDIFNDSNHYLAFGEGGWIAADGVIKVEGENKYYKSENSDSDSVGPKQLFGTVERVNGNVSFTCVA